MLVLCPCPELIGARKLAKIMLDERLAACVQLVPWFGRVESWYRWEGKIRCSREKLLLIKTTKTRWPALRDRLAELHPYRVPEILALEVSDGLPAYLKWVSESVGEEEPAADAPSGATEAALPHQGWQRDGRTT